ncbi:MAG: hypothetical protein WCC27_02810 [Acidobacteriaceae bacterium]
MTELTEELLARAERLYLIARARGEGIGGGYDWGGGFSALLQQGWPSEEKTKWLT